MCDKNRKGKGEEAIFHRRERRIRYPEITKDMGMQRGMEPRRRILDLDPRAVHQRSGCCLTRHKLRRPAAFQEIIQLSLRDRR